MPAPTGSVHAHIPTNPSRAGLVESHSDLVEPGAATCVSRGTHAWLGHLKLIMRNVERLSLVEVTEQNLTL